MDHKPLKRSSLKASLASALESMGAAVTKADEARSVALSASRMVDEAAAEIEKAQRILDRTIIWLNLAEEKKDGK